MKPIDTDSIRNRARQNPFILGNLKTVPLWALLSDLEFLERKLETVITRKENGIVAHKRYPTYELNLRLRLSLIRQEIGHRKKIRDYP
ncbi:MAG: hypothetical protein ACHQ1H_00300 [Nitrososphaerales archaeon]